MTHFKYITDNITKHYSLHNIVIYFMIEHYKMIFFFNSQKWALKEQRFMKKKYHHDFSIGRYKNKENKTKETHFPVELLR